jgi:hypothetical protein
VECNGGNWFWLCPHGIEKLAELQYLLKSYAKATLEAIGMAIENEFYRREFGSEGR